MKRTLAWYMKTAKDLKSIPSDRQLAFSLDLKTIDRWKDPHRHVIPEISTMIKLAKMCNVPETVALIDRDIWEATYKAPETVVFYEKIKKALKLLSKTAAVLLVLTTITLTAAALQPAYAGGEIVPNGSFNLYYGIF